MEHGDSAESRRGFKRKPCDLTPSAQIGWESILEGRKLSKQFCAESTWGEPPPSVWGALDSPTRSKQNFKIDFQLGACVVRTDDGAHLATCVPALSSLMKQDGSGLRSVDLRSACICRSALLGALRFASAGPGANEQDEGLWTSSISNLRPIARASREEEMQLVEEALHCFDMMRAGDILGLPRLEEAARVRLLGNHPKRREKALLCEATAMPLLAASFGQDKRISRPCLHLLNGRDARGRAEILRGRERQLGVIYAIHPVVGAILSGVFKEATQTESTPDQGQGREPASPVLLDLLLGPSRASPVGQAIDFTSAKASLACAYAESEVSVSLSEKTRSFFGFPHTVHLWYIRRTFNFRKLACVS